MKQTRRSMSNGAVVVAAAGRNEATIILRCWSRTCDSSIHSSCESFFVIQGFLGWEQFVQRLWSSQWFVPANNKSEQTLHEDSSGTEILLTLSELNLFQQCGSVWSAEFGQEDWIRKTKLSGIRRSVQFSSRPAHASCFLCLFWFLPKKSEILNQNLKTASAYPLFSSFFRFSVAFCRAQSVFANWTLFKLFLLTIKRGSTRFMFERVLTRKNSTKMFACVRFWRNFATVLSWAFVAQFSCLNYFKHSL